MKTKKINYKAKLDRVFSEYIRRRDADENGNICCISCGKIVPWKESDCGHYVNRSVMSLRFDEKNCNAQCRYCNRFQEGQMMGYHAGLIKKYGASVIDYLTMKKTNTAHYSEAVYKALIDEYKQKISNL